ncbi:DUF6507 family protein [Streptomyces sp. NPDC060031]|uniref:DUF6507 family protein n=1 Tax=Streptomyces sp. NPDC060031 TaxID=3347043 RepID=UPI0036AC9E8C
MADMSSAAQAAGTAVPGSAAETHLQGPVPVGAPPLSQKATGPVGAALAQYLEKKKPELKTMAERIEASILGAAKATREYCEGDLEAAKNAQDAAKSMRLDLLREAAGGAK